MTHYQYALKCNNGAKYYIVTDQLLPSHTDAAEIGWARNLFGNADYHNEIVNTPIRVLAGTINWRFAIEHSRGSIHYVGSTVPLANGEIQLLF